MTHQQLGIPLHSHEMSQLYTIFITLPTGVVLLDGSGIITRANPAANLLLGEPLEGEYWRQIIERSFALRDDDGHEVSLCDGRRVQLSTQPLPDQPGQLIFINDLTKTRELQDRINHMKQLSAVGQMAASLAHQIRTPLAAALLYAANLGNRSLNADVHAQFQQKLLARLEDLDKQVNDILLFTRDSNHQVIAPVFVQDLLNEVELGAEVLCNQHKSELHVEPAEPQLCLLANSHALVGAFNNLIANGLQAGATSLFITAARNENSMEFRVLDNGKGIEPQRINKIFEPFFTTRSQGTGLGLAIVQSVVKAHQGEVSVASVLGEGSCFMLSLPLYQSTSMYRSVV